MSEKMVAVLAEIQAERERQVAVEGYSQDHDDEHWAGGLASAAAAYALGPSHWSVKGGGHCPEWWPWEKKHWKPTTPRRNLVKAAALIVAEIERLDRETARERRRLPPPSTQDAEP